MVHFENSFQYGIKEEKEVLPIIKEFFKRDIKQSTDKWSKYDFFDDETIYELKSRTNTLNKYPDTMITANKIVNDDKKQILLFNFTDCLAYIEYDSELFSTYKKKKFSRAQIKADEKEHIFIPIQDLKIISLKDTKTNIQVEFN
jgi:hypothetical protein